MRKLLSTLSSTLQGGVRRGLLLLALITSVSAIYASDRQVDGIWYDFDSSTKTASVTYQGAKFSSYDGEYSGSVIIPEIVTYNGATYSVTSIGNEAFGGCSSLTSVTIPNSVTSIGEYAFYDCSKLTSVTIGNSVTSIGSLAFYSCNSLTSVTIGNSVTSIGNMAFYGCNRLTKTNYTGDIASWCNIKFGDLDANPMYYSHNFYINDQEINDLVIPNNVTSIGSYAFEGCSSLTSVTIPNSVTSIGKYAFYVCSSLTSVTIGEKVTSIGSNAFYDCSKLTKTNYTGDIAAWCNIKFGNSDANPISQSHNFYINDQEIKDLVIPNSVTSIGSLAFYKCYSLTSVTIGNSVTSIGNSAFYGCSKLTSVTINSDAIVNKDYSSSANISHIFGSQVTKYIIGDKVKGIGNSAFDGCSKLTSVTISNSVTSIGNSAFKNCSKLTKTNYTGDIAGWCNIKFGNSNANPISQSHNLYINDQEIKDLVIPNSVTSIGSLAFYKCYSLTSVTIPNSVTSIGYAAFSGCSKLTSITIPNSVTSIGENAFSGCSKLTSVTINSDAIVNKDYSSFANISHIFGSQVTKYIIGDKVKGIGEYAFTDCSSLTSVTIPNSVTSIERSAFSSCYSLTKTNYTGDIAAWCNIKFGNSDANPISQSHNFYINDQEIKDLVIPNSVTSIGSYAFCGCSSLTSVTIPNSVTSIGNSAFDGCSSLTSVTIPNSVTNIGNDAFNGCSSLTSVTIPNSVTSIGGLAFDGCSKLTSVTINSDAIVNKDYSSSANISHIFGSQVTKYIIGDKVKGIGEYAFNGCSKLTSVTIPNSVTSIGSYAFFGCSSLTSMTIPNSVISIGGSAFYNCSKLTKTNYTGDIAGWCNIKFGSGSANPMFCSHNFYINDQEIKDLVIPNSVTSIGGSAFFGCSSLTSVTIPNSVMNIGDHAFNSCSSLTSITIPNSVTSIGSSAFKNCSSLTSVTIGNSVTSIGENAFNGCSKLSKTNYTGDIAAWCDIKFGNSSANPISYSHNFYNNDVEIKDLVIPNNVTSIGSYAFNGCSKLTSVTCEAETPPTVGQYAFDGVSISIPVYVPCGCVEAYKAKSSWKDFTNIQEPLAEYSIIVNVNDTIMGSAKVDKNTACGNQISATANYGYHFVRWSDGNTNNPRSLELTLDTILTAEFAQSFSGQCGENLYWELIETTLHITGSGEIYNYTSDTAPWKLLVSSIKVLTIAEDVTSIERSAFSGCPALESVVWNAKNYANPTNKETAPFYDIRSQIKSFTFGDKVECIPAYLCYGMEKLTSVTIPNNVTNIGEGAFSNCSALESVVWNAKNCADPTNKEAAPFYDICSQIKSFTFGEAVEHIPAYLCYGMEKLTSITTPNSLNTIGTSAFEGCIRLSKISLGTGLEEIAANAFAGCTRLYDIYVYATYPPFADESSFANYNVYVYVPCEYQRGYTLDVVWGKFKFIKCIESEDATTDGNVTVDPGFNDVTITWPKENNADNYTIVIEKEGKVFCTLTFNAAGQLLNIAFAPSRDGSSRPVQYAEQAVNGYRFTVTGLDEGSAYIYELVIKDNGDNVLQTYSGEFRTQSIDDRTVTVKYDTMQGEVIGAGTYLLGDTATLTVIPNEGYRFVGWTDGNADNPRTLVVAQDTTLTALFEVLTYDVTVTCDPTQGAVTGSGTYNHGDVARLTAIPNEGYRFVRWSNEVEDNPYIFVISEDITLTAEFEEVIYNSVENTTANTSTAQKLLRDGQLLIIRAGKTYDAMGQEL